MEGIGKVWRAYYGFFDTLSFLCTFVQHHMTLSLSSRQPRSVAQAR